MSSGSSISLGEYNINRAATQEQREVVFFMVKKDERKRNWTLLVYEDSAPTNWREVLELECVPGFVSPCHDADADLGTGEIKKPHYHVMLCFRGKKSIEQIRAISNKLSGVEPQPISDNRAYARYLCHLDDPLKAQYSVADIQALAGADYLSLIESAADTDAALKEMMCWCRETGCTSLAVLADYASTERAEWFRVLSSKRTLFLSYYLKSMDYDGRRG
jgi:hypothetical protein